MLDRIRSNPLLMATAALICVAVMAAGVASQEQTPGAKPPDPKSSGGERKSARPPRSPTNGPMPAFTPEREAAAMKFVREHHPEIADLLENLRASRPEQYRRAARELFRASERVSQWKERDAARYDLELKLWKTNSRMQLLLARSTMSPDTNVDAELKSLLAERIDTRLALRKLDREQLAKRLAAADAEIARLSTNKDAAVDRQLTQMRQNIKANRQRVKAGGARNAKRPAADRKADAERPDSEDRPQK